jgi:hypothetical protein
MNARASLVTQGAVHVLATSVDAAADALKEAAPLARGSFRRLVLLVPKIVPYPLALNDSADNAEFLARRHVELLARAADGGECRICVCRRLEDVADALPSGSTVVLSGPWSFWWPTGAARTTHRLLRHLVSRGYRTVFVPAVKSSSVGAPSAPVLLREHGLGRRSGS